MMDILQILREEKLIFSNTVIIMTSNAGAQAIIDPKRLGFGNKKNQEEDYKRMKIECDE